MSCQQNQQRCQLPANPLPKCPPKCPPQAPQAPASCPAPRPTPASSCSAPSCCLAPSCYLPGRRFPSLHPRQPQPSSSCCESESSGCFSCFHHSGGCR